MEKFKKIYFFTNVTQYTLTQTILDMYYRESSPNADFVSSDSLNIM